MLLLYRRRGESVVIGGYYCVTVQSFDSSHIVVDLESLKGIKDNQRMKLKYGQSMMIGDYVTMVARRGSRSNHVNLDFDAPSFITIDRMEIYLKKQREYQEAAELSSAK